MTVVIADSSPLNYLTLIDSVDVLYRLYGAVVVPQQVIAELNDPAAPAEVRRWASSLPDWIDVRVSVAHDRDMTHLDPGERAAIALAQQEHVCRFYVMNAGSIADNARDNVFALLERPLAANSVLLDGPALLTLDRFAAISRGTMVEQLLAGLLIELRWNRSSRLGPGLTTFTSTRQIPLARLRIAATIAMLERPVIVESAFLAALQDYWDLARTINHVVDVIDVPLLSPSSQDERVRLALDLIQKLEEQSSTLERLLLSTMADLGTTLV